MKSLSRVVSALVIATGFAQVALASSPVITRYGRDDTRDWRGGRVVTPAPWPANRVDDPRRAENGRLWVPRSPVGTRTPLSEQTRGLPGPASYGAPAEAINQSILVQQRYNLPVEIVSPWMTYNGRALQGIRQGQQQWLKEQGYVQGVRTHVNPATLNKDHGVRRTAEIKPRAVIRIRERNSKPPEVEACAGDGAMPIE